MIESLVTLKYIK